MAKLEVVILTCDTCGREGDGVERHALMLDGRTVEGEACPRCWTKVEKAVAPLLAQWRRPSKKGKSTK